MKTLNWLNKHFEEFLLTVCLLLILAVSFLQVVVRKIPGINALTWAEEFCRFMWIFSVFLSLPYCIKQGSLLRVEFLRSAAGPKGQKAFDLAADALVFLSMAGLAIASVGVVVNRYISAELSPAMLFPMWVLYGLMLLCYIMGALRALQRIISKRRQD